MHFGILHNGDNALGSFQFAYPTQLDLLHGELAFTMGLQEDTFTQLHPAPLYVVSECCGWTHTLLHYTRSLFCITVRQLHQFLKKVMYEGGYISRVFHFKIVKNYMIFVQQWMGAEGIGNASGLAASMTCHPKGPREL